MLRRVIRWSVGVREQGRDCAGATKIRWYFRSYPEEHVSDGARGALADYLCTP